MTSRAGRSGARHQEKKTDNAARQHEGRRRHGETTRLEDAGTLRADMTGDVEHAEDELVRRQGLGESLSVSKLQRLPQVNAPFCTAEIGAPTGAWRACISRELSPGHIDGNDVFYH